MSEGPPAGPDGPAGAHGEATPLSANRDWRLLWASYGASNLADGVLLAAGPLLVTELTRDPFLVSLAAAVQIAPTFLFALLVGVVVDRVRRRRLQWIAHSLRAVALLVLVAAIVVGGLSLPLVYAVLFAVGTAEVVADTAGETLVAAVVPAPQLGTANSRLIATSTIVNRLAGPPLGAFLVGIGLALPFLTNAVLLFAAAVIVSRLATDGRPRTSADGTSTDGEGADGASATVAAPTAGPAAPGAFAEHDRAVERGGIALVRAQVADGWRFTVQTPPVRRLAVLITVFNLTFGAVYGIQVLWALERLGLDEQGYGTLLTASAVGGFLGSAVFPRLERRFGYATLLRVGLVTESATHFLLASTTSAVVAGAVLVVFGVHEAVWGSLAGAIRLKVVPEHILGRVNSVYRLAVFAPLLLGAALGGVLADRFGILAPFWYAGIGATLTTVLVWRSMADLGSAAEHADATP